MKKLIFIFISLVFLACQNDKNLSKISIHKSYKKFTFATWTHSKGIFDKNEWEKKSAFVVNIRCQRMRSMGQNYIGKINTGSKNRFNSL